MPISYRIVFKCDECGAETVREKLDAIVSEILLCETGEPHWLPIDDERKRIRCPKCEAQWVRRMLRAPRIRKAGLRQLIAKGKRAVKRAPRKR